MLISGTKLTIFKPSRYPLFIIMSSYSDIVDLSELYFVFTIGNQVKIVSVAGFCRVFWFKVSLVVVFWFKVSVVVV